MMRICPLCKRKLESIPLTDNIFMPDTRWSCPYKLGWSRHFTVQFTGDDINYWLGRAIHNNSIYMIQSYQADSRDDTSEALTQVHLDIDYDQIELKQFFPLKPRSFEKQLNELIERYLKLKVFA